MDKLLHLIRILQGQQEAAEEEYRITFDHLQSNIENIRETVLLEYDRKTHYVSDIWECEKSPLKVCVYHKDEWCTFCGMPEERK